MAKYNIFQAIVMSFYSKNLYRDVAVNWGGKTFLYLLILLALSWIVFTFEAQRFINAGYATFSAQYVNQVPEMTVKDGIVHTPENRPYLIKDTDNNQPVIIIDTSGQYTNLDQTDAKMLVTQKQVIMKKKDETRIINISDKFNANLVPEKLNDLIKDFISYAWIILFIFLWLGSFIYRILQAFLYSMIGRLFGSIFKVPLTYGQIVQIAMISITPTIVLASILDFFIIRFPHQLLVYFLLAICYLFYGIVANKNQ